MIPSLGLAMLLFPVVLSGIINITTPLAILTAILLLAPFTWLLIRIAQKRSLVASLAFDVLGVVGGLICIIFLFGDVVGPPETSGKSLLVLTVETVYTGTALSLGALAFSPSVLLLGLDLVAVWSGIRRHAQKNKLPQSLDGMAVAPGRDEKNLHEKSLQ